MGDNKFPFSTMKRLLVGSSEFRANPESVKKFTEKMLAFASELSAKIVAKTTENKRKTIYAEDIE